MGGPEPARSFAAGYVQVPAASGLGRSCEQGQHIMAQLRGPANFAYNCHFTEGLGRDFPTADLFHCLTWWHLM